MKTVIVMMSTYNGEKYIEEQINSILNQEGVVVKLVIRDDGSTDRTKSIIKKYCEKYKNIELYEGENIGYIKSFMWLVQKVGFEKDTYYAFSDQDDVWNKYKLKAAIDKIVEQICDKPIMYYSDLNVVDKYGKFIKKANSWEGNINKYKLAVFIGIRGCTMVYNSRLQELLQMYKPGKISGHDTYIALLAFWTGIVVYDSNAYINYRQTGENLSLTGKNSFDKLKKNFVYVKKRLTVRANIHECNAREILNGYEVYIPDADKLKLVADYKRTISSKIKLLQSKEYFQFSSLINLFNLFFIIIGKL